jgi:hypothetical protein
MSIQTSVNKQIEAKRANTTNNIQRAQTSYIVSTKGYKKTQTGNKIFLPEAVM